MAASDARPEEGPLPQQEEQVATVTEFYACKFCTQRFVLSELVVKRWSANGIPGQTVCRPCNNTQVKSCRLNLNLTTLTANQKLEFFKKASGGKDITQAFEEATTQTDSAQSHDRTRMHGDYDFVYKVREKSPYKTHKEAFNTLYNSTDKFLDADGLERMWVPQYSRDVGSSSSFSMTRSSILTGKQSVPKAKAKPAAKRLPAVKAEPEGPSPFEKQMGTYGKKARATIEKTLKELRKVGSDLSHALYILSSTEAEGYTSVKKVQNAHAVCTALDGYIEGLVGKIEKGCDEQTALKTATDSQETNRESKLAYKKLKSHSGRLTRVIPGG